MSVLLTVKDLSVGYSHSLQRDLSFSLNEGEILFVRGRNGSGKSTLVKTLTGQVSKLSGEFQWLVDSKDVSLLPQLISNEYPVSITLFEILDCFNLSDQVKSFLPVHLKDRKFNDASGGERQKAIILSRIQKNTKVLILDEPFNHLDTQTISDVINFIKVLIDSKIISGVVIISHIDIKNDFSHLRELVLT